MISIVGEAGERIELRTEWPHRRHAER
jgi:hypothetical protein